MPPSFFDLRVLVFGCQVDRFAGSGGLAGGVEDFCHDHVRGQRRETRWLEAVEDHCSEIGERIVFRIRNGLGGGSFFVISGETHAKLVALDGDGVASLAETSISLRPMGQFHEACRIACA